MPASGRLASVLVGALGIALAGVVAGKISAQPAFPDRPIKVVVGFSAGGGTDVIARILAQKLSETLSQSVVVENRTGASGLIAAEAVAKAAPDGYTLMMGSQTTLAVAPTLYRKSGLDPAKEFAGIAMAGISPLVLVVNPSLRVHSVNDVIAMAKASPGAINFGSGGAGTTPHMAAELFSLLAGIRMTHVAYRGEAPAINDLLGGQIALMFPNLSAVMGNIQAGTLRARWPSPGPRALRQRRRFQLWPRAPSPISRLRHGSLSSLLRGRRATCACGSIAVSSAHWRRAMSSSASPISA